MSSSSATILSLPRLGRPSGAGQVLSPAQARADALVSSFVDHATDGYSLAAMVGGGLVYRLGRVGTLALGSRLLTPNASLLTSSFLRYGSIGVGFTGEVFTFEAGQRALRVGIGGADPNLLRWSGENGLGRGLVGAAITLGSLKGTGAFVNGQNPVLQHLFQDSAMVLAHNVSDRIFTRRGVRPYAPTIAEQFVEAEATLWQMNAGMRLVHGAFPGLGQVERSLDLGIRGKDLSPSLSFVRRGGDMIFPFLTEEGIRGRSEPLLATAGPRNLSDHIFAMSSIRDGSGRPSSRIPNSVLPQKIALNGILLENGLGRLSRVLSLRANRRVDAEKVIPLLLPTMPGYRIGTLSFRERNNGNLEIEGELYTQEGIRIGRFQRTILPYLDGPRPALIATGGGLDIFPENHRGKGLGTHSVINDLLFFREMGISTFFVPVGRWGGTFWSERGFDFADPKTREDRIQKLHDFLAAQRILLSPEDEGRLAALEHTWELAQFRTAEGRPVGREFLQRYEANTWMSRFDLDPAYPGWAVLRRSLAKVDAPLRLPPELEQGSAEAQRSSSDRLSRQRPREIRFERSPLEGDLSPLNEAFSKIFDRPVLVEELLPLFYRLPSGFRLDSLEFSRWDHQHGISWYGRVTALDGRPAGHFGRGIYYSPGRFFSPQAKGQGVDIDPNFQGHGLGTLIVLNELLFFKALGIRRYEVPVAKSGGVFWPAVGFDFAHPEVEQEVIKGFHGFLGRRNIVLGPEKRNELSEMRFAWELLRFTDEGGNRIGRGYLLRHAGAWESMFILHDSYPGWGILREALRKIGYPHLLPDESGPSASNP